VRSVASVGFAVVLRASKDQDEAILVVLDDKAEAESMAQELRGRGQDVFVREVAGEAGG
jgi:hypothetical protein